MVKFSCTVRPMAVATVFAAAISMTTAIALTGISPAYAQEAVRGELGKPLQQAQQLIRAQRYKEALGKVREADRLGAKNPTEQLMLDRMRGAAAQGAGENETAARSFEAALNSGRMPGGESLSLVQALAVLYYRAGDYPKAQAWLQRYLKDGGSDPQMRALTSQIYFQNGDYSRAQKELQTAVAADERAGRRPSEESLQLLLNCALKLNDKNAYLTTLEKLVTFHPKKQYWADLVGRTAAKPGFADRLQLDVYRLRLASGLLTATNDYMEMSQLALQAGFAAEGKKVVDLGFKAGVLGAGAEASRQQRLLDLANKNTAAELAGFAAAESTANTDKDGTAQINLGYELITAGQAAKGLTLVEQGLKKGNFKRADDAKLHAGEAYAAAGKKELSLKTLKSVQGTDGTAELARLWGIQTATPMN